MMDKYLNFCVGPVEIFPKTYDDMGEYVPYFRTKEFGDMNLESAKIFKELVNAKEDDDCVFLTTSGSGAMEFAVVNFLLSKDKILVVNGGSFGARFADLCSRYGLNFEEIKLEKGHALTRDILISYSHKGYTALLLNVLETSTGVLYDLDLVSEFARANNIFVIADCVSAFMTTEIDMQKHKVDVFLTTSQKALALRPGLSTIISNKEAHERAFASENKSAYFDFKSYVKDMERGQTPFTPAVGLLFDLHSRLLSIKKDGGLKSELNRVKELSDDFMNKIKDLPLVQFSEAPGYGVSAIRVINDYADAKKAFEIMKDEYHIYICPNGGDLANKVFRVGHMGNLTKDDNTKLVKCLKKLVERKVL